MKLEPTDDSQLGLEGGDLGSAGGDSAAEGANTLRPETFTEAVPGDPQEPAGAEGPYTARDPRKCEFAYADGRLCEGWKSNQTSFCKGHQRHLGIPSPRAVVDTSEAEAVIPSRDIQRSLSAQGLRLVEALESERVNGDAELAQRELRGILLAGSGHRDWLGLSDRELAQAALREILADVKTSGSDRVSASKALRAIEENTVTARELPTLEQIPHLTEDELDSALALALGPILRPQVAQVATPASTLKGKKHPTSVRVLAAKALEYDVVETESSSWVRDMFDELTRDERDGLLDQLGREGSVLPWLPRTGTSAARKPDPDRDPE